MSAPSSDGGGFKNETEVPETSIDFLSPDFNPLVALYASDISSPFPTVPAFNNLAEYENAMCKEEKKANPDPQDRPKSTPKSSKREEMKQLNAERREKIMAITTKPRTEKEKAKEEHQEQIAKLRYKKRHRNLLTRIEEYNTGPMSVLKKCVVDKHFVRVVTRSAVSVRGYCTGYILAFDKHMNLAMIDVDECFIKPCLQKEKRNRRKKRHGSINKNLGEVGPSTSTKDSKDCIKSTPDVRRLTGLKVDPFKINKNENAKIKSEAKKSESLQKSSGRNVSTNAPTTDSSHSKVDNDKTDTENQLFETLTGSIFSNGSDSDSGSDVLAIDIPQETQSDLSQSTSKSDSLITGTLSTKQTDRMLAQTCKPMKDDRFELIEDHAAIMKEPSSLRTSEKATAECIAVKTLSDELSRKVYLAEPKNRVRKNFTPSNSNIIRRHVNQLFVRGDNVVYVSIIH